MKRKLFTQSYLMMVFLMIISMSLKSQNVGIGVSNPKQRLDVNGNLRIGVHLSLDSTAGTIRYNSGEYEGWDSTKWIPLHSQWTKTGINNKDIYRPTGNVGIGCQWPSARFQINEPHGMPGIVVRRDSIGDYFRGIDVQDSSNAFLIQLDRNWEDGIYQSFARLTIGTGYSNQFTLHQNGKIGFGTDNPGNYVGANSALVEFADNSPYRSDWVLRLATDLYYGYPAVIFCKSRNVITNPLSCNGDAGSGQDMLGGFLFNGYDGSTFVRSTEIRSEVDGPISSGIVPGRIQFCVSPPGQSVGVAQEAMRLTSKGYLGIGTTSPAGILDVHPAASTEATGAPIRLFAQDGYSSSTSFGGDIVLVPGVGYGSGRHGRVGIGTATPAGFLDVQGGTALTSHGKNIQFYAQNGAASGNTNGGNVILMPGNPNGTGTAGRVGVGTAAPAEMLDVVGNIKLSGYLKIGSGASYTFPATDGGSGQVLSTNGSGTLSWASAGGGSYLPLAGGTMTDGANIAFGTTSGTKIGTATSQKIGFFNNTPIVKPYGNLKVALMGLGLVGSATIPDSSLLFTDNTVGNVSASNHGFVPKMPNNTTTYLRGDGTWATATTGTVTTVSVVSANGFAGTVANATTTPAITLSTSINGIVKGNGTAISAATAGTDYLTPAGISGGTNTKITYGANGLISSGTSAVLASADFANQGSTTSILHGNAAGNPSWGQIVNADITAGTIDLTTKVTGVLPVANGGTGTGSQNWVDLTTTQTAGGAKTWSALGTFNAGITSTGAAVNLNAGSNNPTNINTGTSTGTVTIGGTAAQTINIGSGTAGNTIDIANGANTAAQTVNIGAGANAANNTINIGSGNTTAGITAITIGTNTNFANTTAIEGGNGASAITLTPQNAGGIVIGAPAGTGNITIGSSSAPQAIYIGTGSGSSTVNIGNPGTSAGNGVNIGNARFTIYKPTAPTTGINSTTTLTLTQVLDAGIIGCAASANRNITMPSAQGAGGLVQALPGVTAVGDVFTFLIYNTGTSTVTLLGGTGGTIAGPNIIPAGVSRVIYGRVTSVTSGSETITYY